MTYGKELVESEVEPDRIFVSDPAERFLKPNWRKSGSVRLELFQLYVEILL
jgi:hypothetical protein